MNLYFALNPAKQHVSCLKECDAQSILFSYAFIKQPEKFTKFFQDGYFPKNLIVDSGAFSVWTKGSTMDIDAYAEFCKGMKKLVPKECNLYVVNLDVLPGKFGVRPTDEEREYSAQKGWENMLYLESKGLKVIHVFHQHENFDWLDKLRNHSDYIGISPANDVSMKSKGFWLDKVFSKIKNTVKTHGFGMTAGTYLAKYPFYSADSSTWLAGARYGYIMVFTKDGEAKTLRYKDINQVERYWPYIAQLGIEKLGGRAWRDRVILSIKSAQMLEKSVTELWTKRGIVWN